MTIRTTLRTLALAGACASALSACVVEPVRRPPPPAPMAEVVPPPPAVGYHWVKGRYHWRHDHWVWVPGHWQLVR